MIQNYDKQKPQKKIWPFGVILIFASSTLFIALYYLAVTDDKLLVPLIFLGLSMPIGLILNSIIGIYFSNDSWRLRDIYRFRAYVNGNFIKFILIFGIVLLIIIGGINISKPIFYGLTQTSFFTNSKLDFETAQAVHRSYMIFFFIIYFFGVHFLLVTRINKKAEELTFSPIRIPNKPSEYQAKGYYTVYYRYFGEKYVNLNGELIRSKELVEWLTDVSKDQFKWPSHDFIPEIPLAI